MKHTRSLGVVAGLTSLGILLGIGLNLFCTHLANNSTPTVLSTSSNLHPPDSVYPTYAYESLGWMNRQAGAIVAGTVMAIGKTKWNQDSGEYWEKLFQDDSGHDTIVSATPFYEITMSIDRLVAGSLGVKEGQLVITVIGFNPLVQQVEAPAFHPKVGDRIIAFIRQGEIGWYSGEITYNRQDGFEIGRKSVLLLLGGPDNSHLLRNENGLYYRPSAKESPFSPPAELTRAISLEELAQMVREKRTMP